MLFVLVIWFNIKQTISRIPNYRLLLQETIMLERARRICVFYVRMCSCFPRTEYLALKGQSSKCHLHLKWCSVVCLLGIIAWKGSILRTADVSLTDRINGVFHNLTNGIRYGRNVTTTSNTTEKTIRPSVDPPRRKKIFLFCYMRGGSSYFGDFFKHNPDVMYWFEPYDAFYTYYAGTKVWTFPLELLKQDQNNETSPMRLPLPEDEMNALVKFNHDVLNCNYANLPTELLLRDGQEQRGTPIFNFTHCKPMGGSFTNCIKYLPASCLRLPTTALKMCPPYLAKARNGTGAANRHVRDPFENRINKYVQCIRNLYESMTRHNCINIVQSLCSARRISVSKGLRLHMQTVKEFLKSDPDTFVLYFVRDPRAIVNSRRKVGLLVRSSRASPMSEAYQLCRKMKSDIEGFQDLRTTYPSQVKLVKYDEAVMDPINTAKDVYSFVGENVPREVILWLKTMKNNALDRGAYSTLRSNTSDFINNWKLHFSAKQRQEMLDHCRDVLNVLGYL